MRLSLCCDCELVSDMGYMTCIECGKQSTQHLETNSCSFTHKPKDMMSRSYSRKSRFFKKCLRMLRCRMNYRVDDNLVKFLKTKEIETPEKLFLEMSLFPCKKRRPFDAIMFYWTALGKSPPQCTEEDIKQLKLDFDNIFFCMGASRISTTKISLCISVSQNRASQINNVQSRYFANDKVRA